MDPLALLSSGIDDPGGMTSLRSSTLVASSSTRLSTMGDPRSRRLYEIRAASVNGSAAVVGGMRGETRAVSGYGGNDTAPARAAGPPYELVFGPYHVTGSPDAVESGTGAGTGTGTGGWNLTLIRSFWENSTGGSDLPYYQNADDGPCCGDWVDLWNASANNTRIPLGDAAVVAEEAWVGWTRDITLGVVLAALSLLTFVGNAMVLHAVRTERRLQTVSNMFIVSLAIADLIVGLVVMPISAIYIFTEDWYFGVAVCQFWIGVDYYASTASILNLFILSLDRYWSVTNPLKYIRQRTKRRALVMISLVWFVSSLWLIPIIGWHHFTNGGKRRVPDNVCDTEYATNTALKIITAIINFYLPLAVMFGLYTKIFIEIRRRSKLELGQRISGGSVCDTYAAVTTSLSDDSDEKNNELHHNPLPNRINHVSTSYNALLSNDKRARTPSIPYSSLRLRRENDAETETDVTDDEIAHLNKHSEYIREPYAARRFVQADSCSKAMDVASSDSDYVHQLHEGTGQPVENQPPGSGSGSGSGNGSLNHESFPMTTIQCMDATDCSSGCRLQHGRDDRLPYNNSDNVNYSAGGGLAGLHRQNSPGRVRFHLASISENANKSSIMLPKENHPAKNQYVKRRQWTNSSGSNCSASMDSSPNVSCVEEEAYPSSSVAVDRQPESTETLASAEPPESSAVDIRETSLSHHPKVRSISLCAPPPSHQTTATTRRGTSPANHHQHNMQHAPRRHTVGARMSYSKQSQQQHSALVLQALRWKKKSEKRKHKPSSALNKEIKAARQLGVIMGAFTLCFFPYFVCFMVVAFCDDGDSCVDSGLMTAVTWIGYLNSTLNPFLYPFCNVSFRRKFRSMLRMSRTKADLRKNSMYCSHRSASERHALCDI